ncbi:sugar phosphate isomerase/epimerase [Pseudonocardia sp. MCCB 268]|nr:sugar phosphate isomerase/epimerase [Pseudonocardia cytotoxica]
MDAAALLGCPTVGTFVGRHPGRTVAENLRDAEGGLPAAGGAGRRTRGQADRRELCDGGWHPDGYPATRLLPGALGVDVLPRLYLNYDPSHLVWMGIDPNEALLALTRDRIPHAQAKDIQLFLSGATATGGRARRSRETRSTSAGGATACPAWRRGLALVVDTLRGRSFGRRARSSTRTRSGAGLEDRIHTGLQVAHRTLLLSGAPPRSKGAWGDERDVRRRRGRWRDGRVHRGGPTQ